MNRVRLHVEFQGGCEQSFTVDPDWGWRMDTSKRLLIISTGAGIGDRITVPFDNILYWRVDTTENQP